MILLQVLRSTRPVELGWQLLEGVTQRVRNWTADVDAYIRRQPLWEARRIEWTGGQSAVDVAASFVPLAVWVGGLRLARREGVMPTTSAVTASWLPTESGYRVEGISGLTTGTKYSVTLVAIGAD